MLIFLAPYRIQTSIRLIIQGSVSSSKEYLEELPVKLIEFELVKITFSGSQPAEKATDKC